MKQGCKSPILSKFMVFVVLTTVHPNSGQLIRLELREGFGKT